MIMSKLFLVNVTKKLDHLMHPSLTLPEEMSRGCQQEVCIISAGLFQKRHRGV